MTQTDKKEPARNAGAPDNLDQMITIIGPKNWLSVTTLAVIVLATILWSIFSRIPVVTNGSGILINESGLREIKPSFSGRIDTLGVSVGDKVEEGQVLATVEQLDLSFQINSMEEQLSELREQYQRFNNYSDRQFRNREMARLNREKQFLTDSIRQLQEMVERDPSNRNKFYLQRAQNQLNQVSFLQIELRDYKEEMLLSLNNDLRALENELIYQKNRLTFSSSVICPYNGTVTEIMYDDGDIFDKSAILMTIESANYIKTDLIAFIYVNALEGKKIRVGMRALVTPSTVEPERHGYIEGQVLSVSKYPATRPGMLKILRNEDLVTSIMRDEVPLTVEVRLKVDSLTYSGFAWTSGTGPETEIVGGTLASSKIIIDEKAPISLILPSIDI